LLQQRIKTAKKAFSYKNNVQSVTEGNRRRVEIEEHRFDIHRSGIQSRWNHEIYYGDLRVPQQLLSAKPQVSGEFIFQQDSAGAYTAW